MIEKIEIGGFDAAVRYDPDISMYRGELQFSKCAADFYARTLEDLKAEGETSLRILREFVEEKGFSI